MLNARDALFNEQVNLTTQTRLGDSTSRMLWAINRNNAIDAQASFASEDASNLARRNRVVTSTNAYSDLTQANIQSVSYLHEVNKYNRALNAKAYGEQVNARYQRGNRMAADEFSKFKLKGTDFSKAYDWGEAIAFQDAAWADGRHRLNEFNNSSILPNEGGFTFAKGVQNLQFLQFLEFQVLLMVSFLVLTFLRN